MIILHRIQIQKVQKEYARKSHPSNSDFQSPRKQLIITNFFCFDMTSFLIWHRARARELKGRSVVPAPSPSGPPPPSATPLHHHAVVHLVTPPCHRHVKAVVAAHFGVSPAPPGLKGLEKGSALLRNGEINDHGGASRQGSLESKEGFNRLVSIF